jgi:hypothetical protein
MTGEVELFCAAPWLPSSTGTANIANDNVLTIDLLDDE